MFSCFLDIRLGGLDGFRIIGFLILAIVMMALRVYLIVY
jgi:hypothetical protein